MLTFLAPQGQAFGIAGWTPAHVHNGVSTLKALPEVIAKGNIIGNRGCNVEIDHNGYRAILWHLPADKENPAERWLVSGFKKSSR